MHSPDRPPAFRLGYRPALDGVRGLAILTVMVVHTGAPFLTGGFLSVDVFFVLSGFLITSVLVEEWEKTKTIDLARFYVRRGLRLIPGLLVLLIGLIALATLTYPPHSEREAWRQIAFTFFYVANWALAFEWMQPMGPLGHAWTLAIEEQFYLAWPLLLLLMFRAGLARRTIAILTGAAIVVAAVHRGMLWHDGVTVERVFFGFDTRCDALLSGCLASLWVSWPGRDSSAINAVLNRATPAAYAVLAAMTALAVREEGYMYYGGFTLVAIAAAVAMIHVVDQPRSPAARALASRPLIHAGKISYGLYLWHWPAFLWVVLFLGPRGWPDPAINAVRFAIAYGLAELSARLVERPALRLKSRWK